MIFNDVSSYAFCWCIFFVATVVVNKQNFFASSAASCTSSCTSSFAAHPAARLAAEPAASTVVFHLTTPCALQVADVATYLPAASVQSDWAMQTTMNDFPTAVD